MTCLRTPQDEQSRGFLLRPVGGPPARTHHHSEGVQLAENRTFFSFGYEQLRVTSADPFDSTVPTAAELTGDFSKLLAVGPQYPVTGHDQPTPTPAFQISPFRGQHHSAKPDQQHCTEYS